MKVKLDTLLELSITSYGMLCSTDDKQRYELRWDVRLMIRFNTCRMVKAFAALTKNSQGLYTQCMNTFL